MIPPARDPRMDRDAPPEEGQPSMLYAPAPGAPMQVVDLDQLGARRRQRFISGLAALLAVAVTALVLSLPRVSAYPTLLEQNLTLKTRLLEIDRRMAEVDRMLLRLRLYDAQLRSLSEARGEHGPIPEEAWSNARLLEAYEAIDLPEGLGVELPPGHDGASPIEPGDLRPAQSWALAVQDRVDTFLDQFTLGEPDINALMNDLESLRAIRLALPGYWPAQGHLTSGFGWRSDPVHGSTKFHSGIDIANRRGAPIYAVASGTVTEARSSEGYGRMIMIDHGYGITTKYAHCTTLRVRAGDRVEMGDYIATMGSTGRSTGPHLHFELRVDDSAVDALKYLPH